MTHPSPSTPRSNSTRRRWWIAPSVLVLGLYAGFFAFAVAQACTITTVTGKADCIALSADGKTYTAFFQYSNTYYPYSTESVGTYNKLVSLDPKQPITANPPTKFYGGEHDYAFSVSFPATNKSGIDWVEGRNNKDKNNPFNNDAIPGITATCAPSITASPPQQTIIVGHTATITATVLIHRPDNDHNTVNPPPALTGSVVFTENGVPLTVLATSHNPVQVTPSGVTSFTTSIQTNSLTVSPPTHTITATYSDGYYAPVSAQVQVIVTALASTCSIGVSPSSTSIVGQPITYTAMIGAASGGTPTGKVDFYLDGTLKEHGAGLTNGQTSFITTQAEMTLGSHTVKAVYGGDASHIGQTCVTTQTVNKVPTTTTVTSSVNPSVAGQPVTFTATVAPLTPNACTPTGSVSFSIDSVAVTTGPVTVNGSGQASLPPNPGLAIGTHNVKAVYNGDSVCDTSYNSLTQTVGNVPPPPAGNTNAYIRIAQAANLTSNPTIDVAIDGQTSFPALNACTVNPYAPLSAGNHTVSASLNGNLLKSLPITFTAGDYYTVAIVDDPTASPTVAPNLVVFQDDLSVTPGQAKVRIYHLNDSAGPISVAANGTIEVASLSFENASSYFNHTPGVENYVITLLNTAKALPTVAISEAANQIYGIFVMNNCVTKSTTGGIPTALPQTGFAPVVPGPDWNAIVFLMGGLAIIGAGAGGVSGLAVVQYRRRRR